MDIFIKTAQLLLSLSLLVILHEAGHFFFARLFKTRVEKFYLFFNPWFSLFKKKVNDTEYGIGWLPLGGFVKISGMVDESFDTEKLKEEPKPYEFRSKPAWQRLLIIMGGVMVNFLLGLFIYIMILYTWGDKYLPNQSLTYGISVDSLGMEAGLQNGDHIVSVDNKVIENFDQIIPEMVISQAKTLQVRRNDSIIELSIPAYVGPELIKKERKYYFFDARLPFIVRQFVEGSAGKAAGMLEGDSLVSINGEKLVFFDAFRNALSNKKGEEIILGFYRAGTYMELPVKLPETGKLGIAPVVDAERFFKLNVNEYSFLEAIPAGIKLGVNTLRSYLQQFKLIFSREYKGYESIGGFVSIGNLFPGQWHWMSFWTLTAFLSIILAIMNLLPIPALDGGYVLFILYEMVTGKKPGDKFMEKANALGMILLLSLLVFANMNDVIGLFK